jgi:hypothetical protein
VNKKLNIDVITSVFMYLLYKNENVTTFDVKQELKEMGYKVHQMEINELVNRYYIFINEMDITFAHIDDRYKLTFHINDNHRVYTFIKADELDVCSCDEMCVSCECAEVGYRSSAYKFDQRDAVLRMISEFPNSSSSDISAFLAEDGYHVSPNSIRSYKANLGR